MLTPRDLSLIDERGKRMLEPGRFTIFAGGSQPDDRSVTLLGEAPPATDLHVTGDAAVELPY